MTDAEWELKCIRKAIRRHRKFATNLSLSSTEARMLALLYKRDLVTMDSLQMVQDGGFDVLGNNTAVFIHKLRKKLRHTGVVINSVWGVGYRMERKEKLDDYIIHI